MGLQYKIVYKNSCTPQEYLNGNNRWYLDSDIQAKLAGGARAGIFLTSQPAYAASVTIPANEASPVSIGASNQDFVFIKNLGLTSTGVASTANIFIALDGGGAAPKYKIKLAPNEAFAAEIGIATAGAEVNSVYMKTGSGEAEQTVQTLRGT